MKKIEDIIKKLENIDGFESGHGANNDLILQAEERLNSSFSPQFIYFLQSYGWIEIAGCEIFGLINENFSALDVVGATESFRYFDGYSDKILIFRNLDEEFVSFDYTRINNEGEPKIIYNTMTEIVEDAADDFASYLEALYEEMLEW